MCNWCPRLLYIAHQKHTVTHGVIQSRDLTHCSHVTVPVDRCYQCLRFQFCFRHRSDRTEVQRLFANNRKYRDKIEHQMAGCQRGLSLSKLATHDYNNVIAVHINA